MTIPQLNELIRNRAPALAHGIGPLPVKQALLILTERLDLAKPEPTELMSDLCDRIAAEVRRKYP